MPDPGKKQGVLIVDDQPVSLTLLEQTLKRDDYQLYATASGDEALELARHERPDLVILDLSFPDRDGLEICRSLKSRSETEDIAVIFLSTVTDARVKTAGLKLGAVDYIHKPFNPGELRARVEAHLRLKSRLDALREQYRAVTEELARGRADGQSRGQPIDQACVERESKLLSFSTDVGRVRGVVNQLLVGVGGRLSTKQRNDLALGVHEMLLNAVEHGNLGISSEEKARAIEEHRFGELLAERRADANLAARRITVEYAFDGHSISCRITDEGNGFDWARMLDRDAPEDLLAVSGRGILIARYVFNRLEYNDKGNEVYLEKRVI